MTFFHNGYIVVNGKQTFHKISRAYTVSIRETVTDSCSRTVCTGADAARIHAGTRTGGDELKNRLEEIRKARGIKQEDLALALEVSRQTIGSLENGRYNPSILLAFKIARYFGMTIEDIFIYEEEST